MNYLCFKKQDEMKLKKMEKRTFNGKGSNSMAKNNDYGITLIALVISVIVLLILAGISVSMLSR